MFKGLGWKLFFGGLVICFAIVAWLFYQIFIPSSWTNEETLFRINKGTSVHEIARQLEVQGLIRDKRAFLLYTKVTVSGHRLRAGTFALSPSYSVANILGHLTHESGIAQYIRVTIPEGFDVRQIAAALEQKEIVKAADFLAYMTTQAKKDFQNEFPFLKEVPGDNIEGYLFPSTYNFTDHDTPKTIVRSMLNVFRARMTPVWTQASGKIKEKYSFHQVMTMASIVQKEARHVPEMPRIASVYFNRLFSGKRLEADPTVVYGLGLTRKAKVYYKDLRKKNPYNTYRKKGLPPTPIASPGVSALKATLNPEKTNYFFFVANRDGTHTFTKTYAEHLKVQRRPR